MADSGLYSLAVAREYAKLAAEYDSRWSSYIQASVQETLSRLPRNDGERILDVGCGTGALLAALAEENASLQLHGIDPVPEMLAMARRRLPERVDLKEAWASNLPFGDGCADTVVSCSVFHYIRDPEQALAEIHRVLVPGGNLVITDWCRDFATVRMTDWTLSVFNAAHFHTYSVKEMEALLNRSGFATIEADRYRIDRWWGLMTVTASRNS